MLLKKEGVWVKHPISNNSKEEGGPKLPPTPHCGPKCRLAAPGCSANTKMRYFYLIIESSRLEETFEMIQSNHQCSTTTVTTEHHPAPLRCLWGWCLHHVPAQPLPMPEQPNRAFPCLPRTAAWATGECGILRGRCSPDSGVRRSRGRKRNLQRVAQPEQCRGLGSQGRIWAALGHVGIAGSHWHPNTQSLHGLRGAGAAGKAPRDPVCSLINLGFLMSCNSLSVSLWKNKTI